jgi:RNA polymerase sigma-70 factor (ECF subfamily)
MAGMIRKRRFERAKERAVEMDWEAIYSAELPRVYNFFRYRVFDRMLAEDLTAVTFEQAWRARHRYRDDLSAFSTWLFTLARNIAADHFRKHRPLQYDLEDVQEHLLTTATEEIVEQQLERARLAALLAQLPEREQELVALKYGAGLTNRAIAVLVGLSESNVGTILHRVVQKLNVQWEEKQ